jgi:hypothetical protein
LGRGVEAVRTLHFNCLEADVSSTNIDNYGSLLDVNDEDERFTSWTHWFLERFSPASSRRTCLWFWMEQPLRLAAPRANDDRCGCSGEPVNLHKGLSFALERTLG